METCVLEVLFQRRRVVARHMETCAGDDACRLSFTWKRVCSVSTCISDVVYCVLIGSSDKRFGEKYKKGA